MPFSATSAINDTVIRSGIYLQNKFLTQCTAITIIHLKKIDWIIPDTEVSFCAAVLGADAQDGQHKLFTSVEKGIGEQKVHLLTTKDDLNEATEWVDDFTIQMTAYNHQSDFWMSETGFPSPPERINKPDSSDAHQAYANFLGQSFISPDNQIDELTAPKNPPTKPSYSRVVYGSIDNGSTKHRNKNDQKSQATVTTQASSTSSLTKDPHEANIFLQKDINLAIKNMNTHHQKEKESLKHTLLDEMRNLNEASSQRMQRIEDSSINYKHMMNELHANNCAKATEFASYEKRFSQIGRETAITANKMNTTAKKVDKLYSAMNAFVKVMVAAVGANNTTLNVPNENKQQLQLLDDFLQEDSDFEMEELENEKLVTPSPDAEIVLGGEGGQK